jgi:hypothetical protein
MLLSENINLLVTELPKKVPALNEPECSLAYSQNSSLELASPTFDWITLRLVPTLLMSVALPPLHLTPSLRDP